jgi:hypothetical protein
VRRTSGGDVLVVDLHALQLLLLLRDAPSIALGASEPPESRSKCARTKRTNSSGVATCRFVSTYERPSCLPTAAKKSGRRAAADEL